MNAVAWSNVVAVLVGAIIAGAANIYGGYKATMKNIEQLREESDRSKKSSIKRSAGILYNDLVGLLREMTYLVNYQKNVGFGSHNKDYSDHIANLEGAGDLNEDEQYTLHRLYGIIMKYQSIVNNGSLISEENKEFNDDMKMIIRFFCDTVYGSEQTFKNHTSSESINGLQVTRAIEGMSPDFRHIYEKIKRIKNSEF